MSKYEKDFDKEIQKELKEHLDKISPEDREKLRKTFDEMGPKFEKLLMDFEEASSRLQDSFDGLIGSFNFTKIVGIGQIGNEVLSTLADGHFKAEALIPYTPVFSEEDKKRLLWSDTVIITAGESSDVESIEKVANLLKSDDTERFVVCVVPFKLKKAIEHVDTAVAVVEADTVILSQAIYDILKIENDNFSGVLGNILKGKLSIATTVQRNGSDDERAGDAANVVLQQLKDNGVELANCKFLLCVSGGKDFDSIGEFETDEIADIIKSKTGQTPALKCSRKEKGMDGKLRVTVVAVLEEK